MDEYNRIWAEFLVSVNKNMTKTREAREVLVPEPVKPAAPDTSWVTEEPVETRESVRRQPRRRPDKPPKAVTPRADRSFTFTFDEKDDTPDEAPAQEPQKAVPVPPPAPEKGSSPTAVIFREEPFAQPNLTNTGPGTQLGPLFKCQRRCVAKIL